MNVWWEIFCRTGNVDAYLGFKDTDEEENDGSIEDHGDSDKSDPNWGLQ